MALRRWAVVLAVASAGAAAAADVDGDGCEDAREALDGACVHPTAVVDPAATIGASARVGPGVSLAAGVIVAPRATLAGADAGPTPQIVGARTAVGRRSAIGVDATLGEDVAIARAVGAGARLQAGDDVAVGYAAVLGDDITLGQGARVGNLAQLGASSTLGAGASVGRGSALLGATSLGAGAHIGPDVQGASALTVGPGARIARGVRFLGAATVGQDARVGRDVSVGAGAQIGLGAVVRSGATLAPGALVGELEIVPRGATVPSAIASLVQVGGAWEWSDGTRATSCETYRRPPDAAHAYDGEGSGTYRVDPSGADAFLVQCDMLADDGGWTKILQYKNTAYTPTAAAAGSISEAGISGFAKLSDARVQALAATSATAPLYRFQGSTTSGTGTRVYVRSSGTFSDPARGWGVAVGAIDVCHATALSPGCLVSTTASFFDTNSWSPPTGNDCDRHFADYNGTVDCYAGPGAGLGRRCVNNGVCAEYTEQYWDYSVWIRP